MAERWFARPSGNRGLSPIFLFLVLALGGCATLAPPSVPLPALTAAPEAFEMGGRIAIRQGDRSDIAKLRWIHHADRDEWAIASPLGNEVARIESGRAGVVVTQSGAPPEKAESFEALTEKLLGVPLNLAMLSAWLHGNAREAPPEWRVTIDETQQAGAVDLARRITARRGDVVVRLVVDEYQALQE
jgi:outer membrane lipoprotein LolB